MTTLAKWPKEVITVTEAIECGLSRSTGDIPCTAGVQRRCSMSVSKPRVLHSPGRRPEGNGGKEKSFCCFLRWWSPHRSAGPITAGAGERLGTETHVQLARSALPSPGAAPKVPTARSTACRWCPNRLVQLAVVSSPKNCHPPRSGTTHPTWQPSLEGSMGWETTLAFSCVGSAALGRSAQHLPTPQLLLVA